MKFMADCLAEIRQGTEKGRIWAQGTARVGEHYKVKPRARHQEAGDQRLRPARGRGHRHHHDGHRAGRRPHRGQPAAAQDARDGAPSRSSSRAWPTRRASPPTTRSGLCIFGMSVTNPNTEFITNAINAAHGTSLTPDFFDAAGPRRAPARARVQPPGRLHREGRRAARVLLHGGAAADQPRGALPRRRRARDVRAPARLSCRSGGISDRAALAARPAPSAASRAAGQRTERSPTCTEHSRSSASFRR